MELNLIESQENNRVKRHDTAVILHLYYPDMWNDMLPYLANLGGQFDLFVTIPYEVDILENIIKVNFPDAQIYRCENRGRDLAPFLVVFSAISKLGYQYICKIHTKKSSHIVNGAEWQQDMLFKLLGSSEIISQIKKAFDEHHDWGLIAPQGHVTPFNYFWTKNTTAVIKLARLVGIPSHNIGFSFVAGSMFWFRPEAFDLLLRTGISTQDFEPEQGQLDGTLAHAFERFFGMAANHAGYRIAESNSHEVRLSESSFQFRLLIQTFQDQERILTEKEQEVAMFKVLLAEKEQAAAVFKVLLAEKEQAAAVFKVLLAEKEQAAAAASQTLNDITNSTGWKMLNVIYRIRLKLAPYGSRRERLLHLGVRAVSYIKNFGFGLFAQQFLKKIKQRGVAPIDPKANLVSISVLDGLPCPDPAISIVIEKNDKLGLTPVLETDLFSWLSRQTYHGIEVVSWDSDAGIARSFEESPRTWDAGSLEELCLGLEGRYLCMASPDLLQCNQTYLEANLIALESEGLAFTVNTFGRQDWLFDYYKKGAFPGNRKSPYYRQIIRRDCVGNDFSIDVKEYMTKQVAMPAFAGKIIVHTAEFSDGHLSFPVDICLQNNIDWKLSGNYILARTSSEVPWEPITRIVHPIDTIMPLISESSNLPTVIIFMPFLAVGGAERLALQLIDYLRMQARFVMVTLEDMDAALGNTVDAFHRTIPFVYNASDFLLPTLNFSFLCYLIERFQADTFYIANGSNLIFDMLGELRQRYPVLRIVNQVYDHQFGWINRYNREISVLIDAHISANPNITHAYIEHGVRPEAIYFVEHAVNMDEVNPADYSEERRIQIKEKLGVPLGKKLVTFCARLHPQKRPLDFVELVRRFISVDNVHFLMVGDGPLGTSVENQIMRMGLKNLSRCKFYTPIADIYAITDVMVLPSEYEAMPLVILETLAMGKPVVATDVGHIRDVVEMTKGGVVISNIGDVTAFRAGVLRALSEPVDPIALRRSIDKRFGVAHVALQYLKVWLGEMHA